MALSGNKGEWSELYVFLKLLAEGRLYSGDGQLNRYDDKFYPILEIFRDDSVDRNAYMVQAAKKNILIAGENINIEIPQERFGEEAKKLLDFITTMDGACECPWLTPFMSEIGTHKIKALSTDKADIRIIIHNLNTGSKPELGYSIKSKLGADSTLINPNKDGTNFIYKMSGITREQVETFNALKRFKDKFNSLKLGENTSISFVGVANQTLHNNLIMLDLGIELIIATSLLYYYSGQANSLDDVVKLVNEIDPCHIASVNQPMYAYKVKQFLLAFALGMTASKPWQGKFHANGGYIVVKEDGDIICYHFFDRNDLEDYLFFNTRFETPSTSRHNFGRIYEENGEFFLKLNLQVRFK